VPSAPVGLAFDPAVTTNSVIGILWNNGISTGGSPILDYRIYYDQAIDDYVELVSGVLQRSYTTQVVLTAGATYRFKIQARNSVGYSLESAVHPILAA
jgi:hypothetical protein